MGLAYFDCPSGASGDMILGALVDAGARFEALARELAGLGVAGYTPRAPRGHQGGLPGHQGGRRARSPRSRPSRASGEILDILEGGRLAPAVRDMASRDLPRLAEAEARVHGTTPERVHFHDVGAVDAIVDVTGACIGLHLLGVDAVHVSALPVGGGFVEGPHGRMPVPGPATAELLKGFPVRRHRHPAGAGHADRRGHPHDPGGRRRG